MLDFISQASLDSGLNLPDDALGHDAIAAAILERVSILPPGSMISIQGPWGRGKTDVLARVAVATFRSKASDTHVYKAIWINPWQYGTPDLLSPVVIALITRIKRKRRTASEALWKAAESVIIAGLSFGLKATALTIPGGKLYEAAAEEAKTLLKGLFDARTIDDAAKPDPDPVSQMAARFAEIVNEVLASEDLALEGRLLICIDDLDRCLPHRQVALLEALRFLVSAGARATFLIAMDPTLARQSVIAHYGSSAFDPERYLDKMFDFRITLPSISRDKAIAFIRRQFAQQVSFRGKSMLLGEVMQQRCRKLFGDFEEAARLALILPDFHKPRMIRRMLDRVFLLAWIDTPLEMDMPENRRWLLLLWLALIERRPELRAALQDAGGGGFFQRRFFEILRAYGSISNPKLVTERKEFVAHYMRALGMPDPNDAYDLVGVFQYVIDGFEAGEDKTSEQLSQILETFDNLLVENGL